MKTNKLRRLFAFATAILLMLFMLNSFVITQKEAPGKTTEKAISTAFRSADGGQTWQDVGSIKPEFEQSAKVVEHEGVLIATGQRGIKRTMDNGESWEWVINEGGVGIAVEKITGGFAAIAYNANTRSRKIHVSFDEGKNWQAIDNGLPPSPLISSIKQSGKYLMIGHPDGIFRSADMGKTWNNVHAGIENHWFNLLPSLNNPFIQPKKVFKLYVSDAVVYAIAVDAGC